MHLLSHRHGRLLDLFALVEDASVELHIKMPRLSLLLSPAVYSAGKGYTWISFRCKYPGLVSQIWMQINSSNCLLPNLDSDFMEV